jgi:hypothetical protein
LHREFLCASCSQRKSSQNTGIQHSHLKETPGGLVRAESCHPVTSPWKSWLNGSGWGLTICISSRPWDGTWYCWLSDHHNLSSPIYLLSRVQFCSNQTAFFALN